MRDEEQRDAFPLGLVAFCRTLMLSPRGEADGRVVSVIERAKLRQRRAVRSGEWAELLLAVSGDKAVCGAVHRWEERLQHGAWGASA